MGERRPRGLQHGEGETESSGKPRQKSREARGPREARERQRDGQHGRALEDGENGARGKGQGTLRAQRLAGGLEQMAIGHAARAGALAPAATQAAVEMLVHRGVVGGHVALEETTHQNESATG